MLGKRDLDKNLFESKDQNLDFKVYYRYRGVQEKNPQRRTQTRMRKKLVFLFIHRHHDASSHHHHVSSYHHHHQWQTAKNASPLLHLSDREMYQNPLSPPHTHLLTSL
jgi:hypothetical protein